MFERFIVAAGLTVAAASNAEAQDFRYYYGDQFTAQGLTIVDPESPVLNGYGLSGIFEPVANIFSESYSHLVVAIPKAFFEDPAHQNLPGIILRNETYEEGEPCAFLNDYAGDVVALPHTNHSHFRAVVALSQREIDTALDLGCLGVQRRGGPRPL